MNISFGSNYLINQGHNFPYNALAQIERLEGLEASQEFCPFKEACETNIFSKITLNSPDEYDEEIERILISNNINFSKTTVEEALNLENIKSRMMLDPDFSDSHKLVLISTDTLNELFKKDSTSYLEPFGANGEERGYENFCKYLKTGKKIYAPMVTINNFNDKLSASISDGRHRFAVLRDMGMEAIPVAIPNYSVEIAKSYGLL